MRRIFALVGRLLLGSTILLAGWYTVYYVYNWQWVRAQIAGIALVATLLIGATWFLLNRMDRFQRAIERRLADLEADMSGQRPAERTRTDDVADIHADFKWRDAVFSPPRRQLLLVPAVAGTLSAASPRTSLFIPILLGAGLLLSAVAGLVERVAAAVQPPAVTEAAPTPRTDDANSHRLLRAGWRVVVLGLVVVAMTIAGVAGLYRFVHYRPESLGAGTTEMTVEVSAKVRPRPAVETVELMARYCIRNAISGVSLERVEPVSADTALLVVSPLLDDEAQRRYSGCLEDANLNRHELTVTRAVLVPDGEP